MTPHVSQSQACKILGCSPEFLETLVEEGVIHKYTVAGHERFVRYSEAELNKILIPITS